MACMKLKMKCLHGDAGRDARDTHTANNAIDVIKYCYERKYLRESTQNFMLPSRLFISVSVCAGITVFVHPQFQFSTFYTFANEQNSVVQR